MKDKITIRPMVSDDLNFILQTWLRSYRKSDATKCMTDIEYFPTYEPKLKSMLSLAEVRIACLTEDPEVILGYLVSRKQVIDYAFVKESWRKMGIFNLLFSRIDSPTHFTHWTPPMNSLSHKYKLAFNPFKFWSDHV